MTDIGAGDVHGNATWDDAAVDLLTKLWSEGDSAGLIARRLGCSRSAIIGKVHRLNLPPRITTRSLEWGSYGALTREEKAARQAARCALRKSKSRPMIFSLRKEPKPPTPEVIIVEPEARMVPLLDLAPGDCRYPFGNGPYFFCGHPATRGPYCDRHHRAAHAREGA